MTDNDTCEHWILYRKKDGRIVKMYHDSRKVVLMMMEGPLRVMMEENQGIKFLGSSLDEEPVIDGGTKGKYSVTYRQGFEGPKLKYASDNYPDVYVMARLAIRTLQKAGFGFPLHAVSDLPEPKSKKCRAPACKTVKSRGDGA